MQVFIVVIMALALQVALIQGAQLRIGTTTELEPQVQLDEPTNSAASEMQADDSGATQSSTPMDEDVCVRCYDKVRQAQDLLDVYDSLLRKQKKLISRKKAAAEAAAASSSRPSQVDRQNSTVRSRTLLNTQPEPIVVSRLRVARSPASAVEQQHQFRSQSFNSAGLNKKDLELERLKREQQRQKDSTCKLLSEVRDCLDQLSRECIGNLQFHSYEVFSDQWHGKLRCPYANNPSLRPLPGLLPRSIGDETKLPVPRPISSDDEVRQRLRKILPDRQPPRSLGVMLTKPTMNSMALASPSNQLHQFRDPQAAGKLLLVPCCIAIMFALLALASLRHHRNRKPLDAADEGS